VPDLGERVAAVSRLVYPNGVCARLEALRLGRSDPDRVREPAHAQRGADEEVLRVGGIDGDLVDPAPQEGVARVRAGVGRVVDTGIGQLRPRVATVRGLVDTDAGFTPRGTAVSLACADVERVPARVVGIRSESADGVESQNAGEPCPARICRQGVVRPPNAAAGAADPE